MQDYLEQWNRLNKYYRKVLNFESHEQSVSSDECLEEMYLFFENCLKLRDWIRNSDNISEEEKVKVLKIFEDKDLSVAVGLANRRKHLKPDHKRKYGDSSVVSHSVTVMVPVIRMGDKRPQGASITRAKYSWGLRSGGENFELIHLAKRCMMTLEKFMSESNLLK